MTIGEIYSLPVGAMNLDKVSELPHVRCFGLVLADQRGRRGRKSTQVYAAVNRWKAKRSKDFPPIKCDQTLLVRAEVIMRAWCKSGIPVPN